MEEDIKIIKASKIMSDDIPHSEHSKRLRKAIEKLIKGYRELEEIVDKQKRCIYELENTYRTCAKEYIVPKSKIKEKIEEKQKRIDKMHPASDCVIIDDLENQIDVLKELMEDK